VTFDRAKARPGTGRFSDVRWVAGTGSTNADLVAAARAGEGEQVLVADHQDAGRGRLDRRWEAPPGASLLMSVLVRPPFPGSGPQLLTTALGIAAVDALRALAGVDVALKWPNDVVAPGTGPGGSDLKLGGLLAEYVAAAPAPGGTSTGDPAVVLGIGCNLDWPDGFPPELADTATAVNLLGGRVEREDLVREVLGAMGTTGDLADDGGACARLLDAYRERCVTIGRRVRVELPTAVLVGTAVDVDAEGALVVEDDQWVRRTVTVGDVVHLRPA
jgi:BirA family transcriptional regulator, biotin operon repressor / biotin---[acetyl-CoA-carboxylase] ligase